MLPLKKYAKALGFMIGLFCSECFTYEGLVERLISGELGIDPRDVRKINIKGKILITTRSGDVKAVPLKRVKKYACSGCSSCPDFSAELADISVGGIGLNAWNIAVIRTDKGEDLLRRVESEGLIRTKPVEEERHVLDMLVKFSARKRRHVKKHWKTREGI
jgi:coenzyme F420 hydrogenase subunit beta